MAPVIVIGAGPAGCAAALALSSRKIETLILERKKLPRPKTCAGGLSPWTLGWLRHHGLLEQVLSEANLIRGARLWTSSVPTPLSLRGRLQAAVLPRRSFDAILARAAQAAGAELREGLAARSLRREGGRLIGVETEAGLLPARAVVVASGASGRLSPRPAERADRFFGIMTRYRGLLGIDDSMELFLNPALGIQYGWIFPEGPDLANVGICFQRGPGGANARELLDRFLDRHLASRLAGALPAGRVEAHPIRALLRPPRLVEEGVLHAGEAAGLVDPLTGEGIYLALRSGELAGRCLAARLAAGRSPTRAALLPYAVEVALRLSPRLAVSGGVLALTRSPAARLLAAVVASDPIRRAAETLYART